MLKNNNFNIIKKITRRLLKNNKTRNILVIFAIFLTTFMITSIFSIGFSIASNYQTMTLRQTGTNSSVTLKNPTKTQIKQLKSIDTIESVGLSVNVAESTIKQKTSNLKIQFQTVDNTTFKNQITPAISSITGHYPKQQNEISLSKYSLSQLGIKQPILGMEIPLTYKVGTIEKQTIFKLSGYFTDYQFITDTITLFTSNEFAKENQTTIEQNGFASLTIKTGQKNKAVEEIKQIKLEKGQQFNFDFDPNEEVISTTLIASIIVIIISLFIVLSGYLLIYNVLYISVIKDIHFYGLLKTIGASPKQIKKIVKLQALILSCIGIPIGILTSILISFLLIPKTISSLGFTDASQAMPTNINFHPLIFLGGILFAFITTLISCKKPAKIASTLSPIEAIHFTGNKNQIKKKNKKSTTGGKLYKMAFHNIFRNKKRTIIVFLSLFMGIISFLSIDTFLSGIKLENFIKEYLPHDISIENIPPISQKWTDQEINQYKTQQNIKNIYETKAITCYIEDFKPFIPFIESELKYYENFDVKQNKKEIIKDFTKNMNHYSGWVMSVDTDFIKKELGNSFPISKFDNGEIVLINLNTIEEKYKKQLSQLDGKSLTLIDSSNTNKLNLTIKTITNNNFPVGNGNAFGFPRLYISHNTIKKLNNNPINYLLDIDIKKEYIKSTTKLIKQDFKDIRSIRITDKQEMTKQLESSLQIMNILGNSLSFILILIGILNFINIMITSVRSRTKELSVLESIGMTLKQARQMVIYEGMYYALITCILICTAGVGIIYGIAFLTKQIVEYAVFTFPIYKISTLIGLLFLICMITPIIVLKNNTKKPITERLRNTEK